MITRLLHDEACGGHRLNGRDNAECVPERLVAANIEIVIPILTVGKGLAK